MIDIIEGHGHHWSLWTYKDIGMMGTILVNPESEWMDRTKPIRKVKSSLRCDSWIERIPKSIDPLINQVVEYSAEVIPFVIKKDLLGKLQQIIQDGVLAQALLPAFVEQYRNIRRRILIA